MAKKKHSLSIWKTKWDIANVSHVEYFGYTWCEQGIVTYAIFTMLSNKNICKMKEQENWGAKWYGETVWIQNPRYG